MLRLMKRVFGPSKLWSERKAKVKKRGSEGERERDKAGDDEPRANDNDEKADNEE